MVVTFDIGFADVCLSRGTHPDAVLLRLDDQQPP
jgi:hypothetical protein